MSGSLTIRGGCGRTGHVLVAESERAGDDMQVFDLPQSIETHPPRVPALAADAASVADLERAASAVPSGLAGPVALSGVLADKRPGTETDPDTWNEVLTGNLIAGDNAVCIFHRRLSKGGSMVMTGSGLGHFARRGCGPYAVAKAGIAALTRRLALEWPPDIRVKAVAPTAVDTAFLRGGTGRSDENGDMRLDLEACARTIPRGRIAGPQDVTGPIRFLVSAASRYVTGQVIHVNGGTYVA